LGVALFVHGLDGLTHRATSRTTRRPYRTTVGLERFVVVASVEILRMDRGVCGRILARATSDEDVTFDGSREDSEERIINVLADETSINVS
jgi:hypothetical protein